MKHSNKLFRQATGIFLVGLVMSLLMGAVNAPNVSETHGSIVPAEQAEASLSLSITGVFVEETKESFFSYTDEETQMITAVVMHEVGHTSHESMIAVTNLIVNRLNDGRFGNSIYEVLHSEGQFEAIHNYYNKELPPSFECQAAVMAALQGEDNAQGALYYCNPDYVDADTMRWFESLEFVYELDGQRFYR